MKSSIFYAARVLATVFCLAAVSFAAGGTEYCSFGKDRECVLRADSITYNNLPDSLKTTLQERFDKDSSFVFWGNVKSYDFIAYTTSSHTHYSEDISNEDRKLAKMYFLDGKKATEVMEAIPWYSSNTFTRHNRNVSKALIETARKIVHRYED